MSPTDEQVEAAIKAEDEARGHDQCWFSHAARVAGMRAALTAALARHAERERYDPVDPRCLAAHNAGEATAVKLLTSDHDFSPKYVAMAVVQDALAAYLALSTSRPAQAEDGWVPTRDELNLMRQWFNVIADADSTYMEGDDRALMDKIMAALGGDIK